MATRSVARPAARSVALSIVRALAHVIALGATSAGVAWGQATAPAAAVVQIVTPAAPRVSHSADADSAGRFRIEGLAPGRYIIGFFHPLLDSLEIEAPLREVIVAAEGDTR